jgi:hypothetical protein
MVAVTDKFRCRIGVEKLQVAVEQVLTAIGQIGVPTMFTTWSEVTITGPCPQAMNRSYRSRLRHLFREQIRKGAIGIGVICESWYVKKLPGEDLAEWKGRLHEHPRREWYLMIHHADRSGDYLSRAKVYDDGEGKLPPRVGPWETKERDVKDRRDFFGDLFAEVDDASEWMGEIA